MENYKITTLYKFDKNDTVTVFECILCAAYVGDVVLHTIKMHPEMVQNVIHLADHANWFPLCWNGKRLNSSWGTSRALEIVDCVACLEQAKKERGVNYELK